ncbi:MAG: isochorismatase family protein [Clostridiales bacterium]|nr:isochorismatase family protein [Clostridiales bacterium]
MDKYILNSKEVVLFIIDIQDKLVPVMKYKNQVINNNKILINGAREMNFPIIATEQYPKGLGKTVVDLLDLLDEKKIFEKNSFSAYTDQVKTELKVLGRKKVIITGMEAHICVFQTVRDLIGDGYQVFLAQDAIASRSKANYLNGLDLCKSLGAVISNTETIVYDLLKVSGTPEFKAMLKMIK